MIEISKDVADVIALGNKKKSKKVIVFPPCT